MKRLSNELRHFGINGMKWGVRKDDPFRELKRERLRDKKLRKRADRNQKNVQRIISTLSNKEYEYLNPKGREDIKLYGREVLNKEYNKGSRIVKRIVIRNRSLQPVAFADLKEASTDFYTGKKNLEIDLATRAGDKYRGNGYASKAVDKTLKYYKKNKNRLNAQELRWSARKDNVASNRLAQKKGFRKSQSNKRWNSYLYD